MADGRAPRRRRRRRRWSAAAGAGTSTHRGRDLRRAGRRRARRRRGRRALARRPRRARGRRRHDRVRAARPRRRPRRAAGPPGAARRARHLHHRDDGARGARRGRRPRVPVRAGAAADLRRHRFARASPGCGRRVPETVTTATLASSSRPSPSATRARRCPTTSRQRAAAGARRARAVRRRPSAADQRRGARPSCATRAAPRQATASASPSGSPPRRPRSLNGVLAHSLDFDDTHLPSVLHPSAPVVPAALAAAEHAGATGARRVAAIAVGLEVVRPARHGRVRRGLGNSVFFEHGQHATSICGAMGGAVAAARCSGWTRTASWTRSGVAGVDGGRRDRGEPHRAAPSSGCTAAGPPTPRSPPRSWCGAASPARRPCSRAGSGSSRPGCAASSTPDAVTDGLGAGVGGAGHLLQALPGQPLHPHRDRRRPRAARAGLDPRTRSSRSTIGVPSAVVRTIGQPIEVKRAPETAYQAQFSGPYAVAAGLLGGAGLGAGARRLHRRARAGPRPPRADGARRRGRRRRAATRSSRTSSRPSSGYAPTTAGSGPRRC